MARSVWTVYTTGYAVAAAELGKEELLVTLIAQQIRNAVFNKTFYEVYNADDGRAWRWPAQTWNAIGYISLLLSGVFGLKKDIEGIWFEGFIPTVLSGIRIFNLRYVNMCLDVSSEGEGKIVKMTLNGVGQISDGYRLRTMHTTNPVGIREINPNRCSRIQIPPQHSGYFSNLPTRPTAFPAAAPATLPAMLPARPAIWFTLRP